MHLGYLTILSGVAMAASAPLVIAGSIPLALLEGELLHRTKTLLAFTLVGFVSFMVNRWNTIRQMTVGTLWGAMENLNVLSNCALQVRVCVDLNEAFL